MAFSPRIVGEHRPDYHSLKSLLGSRQFVGKTGEELVLALYDVFTSTEDGTWHFWPVDELQGQPRIRRFTSDPIKLLTNYGWHICGQSSCIMYGIYTAAGLTARQISVPGHLLCEVYYDDAWHILDIDMWTWFRKEDGSIASAYDLATHAHELIVDNSNTSSPCNLPDRSLEDYAIMYAETETVDDHVKNIFPHWSVRSHQLDFYLRPGESLQRSETPNGCFIFSDDWLDLVKNINNEWAGCPRERFEPFRSYGSGRWTYAPNLSARYEDVACGYWSRSGCTQTLDGLSGAGQIAFRMQSPYICCAKPDLSSGKIVYTDGASLRVHTQGAVQLRLILEERSVELASITEDGETFIDLTNYMCARYEAIIEFTLAEGALVRAFTFSSPIMSAPKSMPALRAGVNDLRLCQGDDQSSQTIPWKQLIDFTPQAEPQEQWVSARNASIATWAQGWKCIVPEDPAEAVELVYHMQLPAGKKMSWFHALCSVKEGPEKEPQKNVAFYWSTDATDWQLVHTAKISNSHLGWDMSVENDVLLAAPVEAVFLRIVSETAVTGVEFYGHLDMTGQPATELEVQHAWKEGEVEQSAVFRGLDHYQIACQEQAAEHVMTLIGLSREKQHA